MDGYKINVENIKTADFCTEITVKITGAQKLNYPRISACFYSGEDNRILPMDIKSCDGNTALAVGIFDIPFLFYHKKNIGKVSVKFLFSDSVANNIILSPEEETIIPVGKTLWIRHFFKTTSRERKKMLFSVLMSVLFLPYRCLKVEDNRITFLTNRSDNLTGNIKAVFYEMTKQPDLDINVMCKKGGVRENLPNLFKFFKLYATSKIVFVDDYYHFISYLKKKNDVKLIQLWHACGAFKTFGFSRLGKQSYLRQSSPNHRQYDYVIVSSEEVVPYYAEGFGVSMEKVIPLGSPRCDMLKDERQEQLFKRKFYKENPKLKGKKIMLFAPTFRGGGMGTGYYPIEKFDAEKLLSRLDDDWVIVTKMHPYLDERPTVSRKYRSRMYDFTKKYDINDLLLVTALLMTDYSSIIFEASIRNIPMLFFAFDLNEYSKNRSFYCDYESFVPGRIVMTMEEAADAVNKNDFKQELVKPFCDRFFGDSSGQATQNVVNFTKELLK